MLGLPHLRAILTCSNHALRISLANHKRTDDFLWILGSLLRYLLRPLNAVGEWLVIGNLRLSKLNMVGQHTKYVNLHGNEGGPGLKKFIGGTVKITVH